MTGSITSFLSRVPLIAVAASLILVPGLFAQTPAPVSKEVPDQPVVKENATQPAKEKLYSLKFEGSATWDLNYALREQLSTANVVITDSARSVQMPGFELINVRLSEIARTIEFLSEGQLHVEVSEDAGNGSLWRIGRRNPLTAAMAVKVRAVAAPNLFRDEVALKEIQETIKATELSRLESIGGPTREFRPTFAKPLESQKIFVIIGDDDGVAGMESQIKAAEHRLDLALSAKVAALAANGPKTRAILAPHVIASETRRKSLMEAMELMRKHWDRINADLMHETDSGTSGIWGDFSLNEEQKVFIVSGNEAGINGLESLIKAAEQLAAEEDERIERIERAKEEQTKAAEAESKE